MNNYIDKIMSNHVFHSESSEDLSYLYSDNYRDISQNSNKNDKQKGGRNNDESPVLKSSNDGDVPTGGFPPIFIINAKEKETEQSKTRQLAGPGKGKATVSIKDILKSKK